MRVDDTAINICQALFRGRRKAQQKKRRAYAEAKRMTGGAWNGPGNNANTAAAAARAKEAAEAAIRAERAAPPTAEARQERAALAALARSAKKGKSKGGKREDDEEDAAGAGRAWQILLDTSFYGLPRYSAHLHPSFLELNDIL